MSGQSCFPSLRISLSHGGELARGKRKIARPIVTKRPMHLVLRASAARGKLSLLQPRNASSVRRLLQANSNRFAVRVYEAANVGNHLHLLVRARTRKGMKGFLRAFAGAVAMSVTGARKGRALKERFWDYVAFSRVVQWGKSSRIALAYLWKNQAEGQPISLATRNDTLLVMTSSHSSA